MVREGNSGKGEIEKAWYWREKEGNRNEVERGKTEGKIKSGDGVKEERRGERRKGLVLERGVGGRTQKEGKRNGVGKRGNEVEREGTCSRDKGRSGEREKKEKT